MPASAILLIEADLAAAELITSVLARLGYLVNHIADPDEALGRVPEHQLVIIDVVAKPRTPVDLCREIRTTRAMARIPILCISQTDQVEERITFLEAGADDVMAKPFDGRELEARVEALLLRFQRSKDLPAAQSAEGRPSASRRVLAVFGPKGGTGTTTIATNISVVQAQRKPDKIVLVDLSLQFGAVATQLNLAVRQSLADVIREEAALREPELLRTFAIRHDSGLHVLAAPTSPELGALVEVGHVDQLLDNVLSQYDAVVVDAGSTFDDRTALVFERADAILIPVIPEIAALKAVRSLLDYLNDTGELASKASFVLNNLFARELLRLRDVEAGLGAKVAHELPYDPFLYLKAVNEGVPVVWGASRSAPAEALLRIAAAAFNEPSSNAAPAPAERRTGRLTGLLRRP